MRRWEPWAVGALVAGALVARLLTYRALPHNINNDEFEWSWAGQSLLLHGHPSSWSYLAGYPPSGVMANPVTHSLLPWQPRWVDHPPLFAALVGVFALLAGETSPGSVSLSVIRLVPVLCSVACVGLLYVLVRRHLGRPVAFVAAALLAFTPVAITASALVEAEWLLAVFLLGALLLIDRADGVRTACLLAVCTVAPLVKETGVLVPSAVAVLLLIRHDGRRAAMVGAAGVLGTGLIVVWGAMVDWPTFLLVMHAQFARHIPSINPLAFPMSLAAGYGNFVPFRDPIWYAGLVGVCLLAALAVIRRMWRPLVLAGPVLILVVMFIFISIGRGIYFNGWYRLTIYPLVYAAAAWLLVAASQVVFNFAGRLRRHPRQA